MIFSGFASLGKPDGKQYASFNRESNSSMTDDEVSGTAAALKADFLRKAYKSCSAMGCEFAITGNNLRMRYIRKSEANSAHNGAEDGRLLRGVRSIDSGRTAR